MKKFTRESILQAIKRIDENPELRKGRESIGYDLIKDDKKYPPILVLSESNKILGGSDITIRDFNNSTKKAFKFLTDNGFEIMDKEINLPNIWFVCQGVTFTEDRGKKFLWAPKFDKNGNMKLFWENMKNVKKGDLIFNYSKGVRGVSLAKDDCYNSDNSDINSGWGKEGYRVDINLYEFENSIDIKELKKRKAEMDLALRNVTNKPFNVKGDVNQGYLYEFTIEAARIIRKIYNKPFGINSIDEILDEKDEIIFQPENEHGKHSTIMEKKLYENFKLNLELSGLIFEAKTIKRFLSSLITKPFLILTGLSGSGKTKLAQAFSRWICTDKDQYCIVPVGADWTNREPLLGYPNALSAEEYVKPDNGALDLLIRANEIGNSDKTFFLILDEMNLSHVERYFADFLSVMESKEEISLYTGSHRKSSDGSIIPPTIGLPNNLFLIGTVNIDETTYMFSPKVLDRANVIEFRVKSSEIEDFLIKPKSVDLKLLDRKGTEMAKVFLDLSKNHTFKNEDSELIKETLVEFFKELKKLGAEFGYRSATEIVRLINQLGVIDSSLNINTKVDIAIMQKLLPKLHGSRRKLTPVLIKLGEFCIENGKVEKIENEVFGVEEFDCSNSFIKYPISLEKLIRMYKGAVENGFASYAEA